MFISVQFTFFFLVPTLSEVKVAQSFPTLCDPMDCTVQGILQARILEWVAVPFSNIKQTFNFSYIKFHVPN